MKRKWPRRVLIALLVLLLLLLVVVFGAYAYLTSDAGGARIRDTVLETANGQFKGKLTSEKVDVSATGLVLEGLKLYDPEGELVAEIRRVEVDVSPAQLLGAEIKIGAATVFEPRLYLKKDERGLNLLRALESKNLRPSELTGTKGPEKSSAYRIGRFELKDGYVDYLEELDDPDVEDRHIRATGLTATGSALYATGPSRTSAQLQLDGALELPTPGPIRLTADFDDNGKNRRGALFFDIANTTATFDGTTEGTERAQLEFKKVSVDPKTAHALLPSYPLKVPLRIEGRLTQAGNVISTETLLLAGEQGGVTVNGGFDIARFRVQQLIVGARNIDLEELIADGPKSKLALELRADGGGTNLNNLDATVTLDVPASLMSGQPFGPFKLRADAKNGKFHVPELSAIFPGATLNGAGEGNLETVDFKGELRASDLSKLARGVGEMTPREALPINGNGSLLFHVTGPTKHPALSLVGNFSSLRYDDYRLTGLSLNASLADVTRPLEADATVRAKEIRVGERAFENLTADVRTRGRLLSADLTAQGLTNLLVRIGGTIDEDSEGLLLSELNFEYPEAKWTLDAPSQLRWADEAVTVAPLSLSSGAQQLVAQLSMGAGRIDAKVKARQLDLGRLPAAFVDKSWNLAGTVNLDVAAKGGMPKPNVVAKVDLAGASFRDVKDAKLVLDGSYERDRLKGTLDASAGPGAIAGRFDVPVTGLLKRRHEPLEVVLDVPKLELRKALAAAGRTELAEGTVVSSLNVSGFADAPVVIFTLKGDGVRYGTYPPKDQPAANFLLEVTPKGDHSTLNAKLDVEAYRSHALISLQTPFTVAALHSKTPDTEALMTTPVTLTVDADRVDLSALDETSKGSAVMTLTAQGTGRAPLVTAKLQLSGVQRGTMKPLDGTVDVAANEATVAITALVTNAGQALLNLTVNAQAPLRDLIDEQRRERVPLKVDGRVSPVTLSTLRALSGTVAEEEEELLGTLSATLRASGSLADPRINLEGTVEQLGISKQALGRVGVTWFYNATKHSAVIVLASPSGGTCDLTARTRLDVSSTALKKPLEWESAPVEGSLNARNFDLQFLSGIHPKLRTIGGTLEANGTVGGTLGAPTWMGAAEWSDGRLALMGYGDYRKIHLKALVSNERYFLEDLSAQSGGGTMQFTADARKSGAAFGLTMSGVMDRFPIIYDDQLFAIASLKTTARGEATSSLVNISELAIPEAHLELPQIKRKDLQDLDRPDDVLLVRDGQIIDKKQAKKRAERMALEAAKKSGDALSPVAIDEGAEPDEESTEYRVIVNAPGNLWVRGADVNIELGLSEAFRIEYNEALALFGNVNIRKGSASVIGRRFTVAKNSSVRFQGAAGSPVVNLNALYVNEREQITVFMGVRYDNSGLALRPTSQPALSESEIWTLLATGRRQLKRGSGASMTGGDAATIVSSAIAAELRKTLPSKVPLDVLSIEGGDEGLTGSRLEAGTYVTDKIYVGYTGRLGANPQKGENSHAVRFEYQFSPRWSFESSWGDANAGGADIVWTRDY